MCITPKVGDTVSFYYDNDIDDIKTTKISFVNNTDTNEVIASAPVCEALKECAIGESASFELENKRSGDIVFRYVTVVGISK